MYSNTWGEIFGTYGATFWIFFLVVLLISVLIQALFLLNLRDLLRQVSLQNRAMAPNLVWLNFIPFFSYAWMIYTVVKIRDSVEAEMRSRGMPATKDPAYGVGMGYAVLSIVGAVLGWATPGGFAAGLAALGGVMGVASLVLWILYWVRTSRLKNELRYLGSSPGHQGFGGVAAPAPQPTALGPRVVPAEERCSSCGLLSMPGDETCRSCGAPLGSAVAPGAPVEQEPADSASAYAETAETDAVDSQRPSGGTCPFCGADYPPNAKYCSSCGQRVA